jgi:hypothetical protein
MNLCLRIGFIASLSAAFLAADATYNQTTKFKGGTLIEMTQKLANMPLMGHMMGGGMKQAFADQHYDVFIKGNKMARLGGTTSTIYDLDAGTITNIDNTKQTYSTLTFDEMREQMQQAQQRMNKGQGPDIQFDVKVDKTGQTQELNGETAKETLITMTAKQANAQGQMVVKVDTWLVPVTPATQEIMDFHKRLAEKFSFALSGFSPAMGSAGAGLSAAMKESFQQGGFPVLMNTEISGLTSPGGPMGAMGGGNADPNTPLIKEETDSMNFAQGAVDDAKFSVPAGYTEDKRRRR